MSNPLIDFNVSGGIATIRLMREEQRNALSADLIRELAAAVNEIRSDPEISVVILTGGDRYFSAGADKNDPEIFAAGSSLARRRGLLARADVARALEDLPQITIAAIEGYAVGGGCTLALCCDFRVISEKAFLSVPEIDLGVSYGWNSIPRLSALVGPAVTKRIVLLGERIPAGQALGWGLVDFVQEEGSTMQGALQVASKLIAKPRLALEINKRAINGLNIGLMHLSSHADTDQSILCRVARETDTGQGISS